MEEISKVTGPQGLSSSTFYLVGAQQQDPISQRDAGPHQHQMAGRSLILAPNCEKEIFMFNELVSFSIFIEVYMD